MKEKPDSYYQDVWRNFCIKFDCAVKQIEKRGFSLTEMLTPLTASGTNIRRDKLPYSIGVKYISGTWFIPNGHKSVSPLIMMLEGHKQYDSEPLRDLELRFGFVSNTLASAFYEGFGYNPGYKDVWTIGFHWSVGAGFHIGRYYLEKYFNYNKLKYTIPKQLEGILT